MKFDVVKDQIRSIEGDTDDIAIQARKKLLTQAFLEGVKNPASHIIEGVDTVYLEFRRIMEPSLKKEFAAFCAHLQKISHPDQKKESILDLQLSFMQNLEHSIFNSYKKSEVESVYKKGQELGRLLGPEQKAESISLSSRIISLTSRAFSFFNSQRTNFVDRTLSLQDALLAQTIPRHQLIDIALYELFPAYGLTESVISSTNEN